MKKLLFSCLMMVCLVGMSQAQTKSCSKMSKASCAKACSAASKAAAKAASLDTSIEQSVCSISGKVSYAKKNVDETTGAVTMETVYFDDKVGQFVNVSPAASRTDASPEMKQAKKTMMKAEKVQVKAASMNGADKS